MILADSNIIIEFWKRPAQKIVETFKTNHIAICPVIKIELIYGARDRQEKKISKKQSLHFI
jgi:predicted nucleic acid-binding protein